jgi:choline-sulfatase
MIHKHLEMSRSLNILMILSDQHNPRVMGCAGDPWVRTPNLDRLARQGSLMEQVYCASPVCIPSRMSFMTGRRPSENRVIYNDSILDSGIETWPEKLNEAGYETALIGRMHFEGPDQQHGFERTDPDLVHWREGKPVRFQNKTDRVPDRSYWSDRLSIVDYSGSGTTFVQHRDEVVCERACRYLMEKGAAAGGDVRPFAAVVGFYQPHPPYIGRKELYNYYYANLPEMEDETDELPEYLRAFYRDFRDWHLPEPIDPESRRRVRAAYYANCEHLDQMVGKVLASLKASGLEEDTLVIYTSDHGNLIGQHGLWGKNAFFDESVRVPFIARLPGVVQENRRSEGRFSLRSLGNTFCEIAGAQSLAGSDALSVWKQITGEIENAGGPIDSEIVLPTVFVLPVAQVPAKMVIENGWKLWCYYIKGKFNYSLYHLAEDPDEKEDRIAEPGEEGRIEHLKTLLHRNWDPQALIKQAEAHRARRMELEKEWELRYQYPGYAVPDDLDHDVDSLHSRRLEIV